MKIWKTLRNVTAMVGIVALGAIGHYQIQASKEPVRIVASPGGSIIDFIEDYAKTRHTKKEVRVEDICLSACTMVLGLVPRDRVCANPGAVFGFHSAWFMGPFGPVFSREGTRLVWNVYPDDVKDKLRSLGWDGEGDKPHPELVYVKATEFVKECSGV